MFGKLVKDVSKNILEMPRPDYKVIDQNFKATASVTFYKKM